MTTETTHLPRSVAITGAGSGLGKEIGIGFADKGYRVFGTARTPEEIDDVRQATHGVADLTICDITDEDAVRGWANETSDALGDAGLRNPHRAVAAELCPAGALCGASQELAATGQSRI